MFSKPRQLIHVLLEKHFSLSTPKTLVHILKFSNFSIPNFELGAILIIEKWHLEYKLKKNSHHLELSLIVEKGHISNNNDIDRFISSQNTANVSLKIDLMSDDKILTKNKAFQEVITKLKNQLMKVLKFIKTRTEWGLLYRRKLNISHQ